MKRIIAAAILSTSLMTAIKAAGDQSPAPESQLCTTWAGPAFAILDRVSLIYHGTRYPGVTLVSLSTGTISGRIPISKPILSATVLSTKGQLILAIAGDGGINIDRYDTTTLQLLESRTFAGLEATLAIFTPNGANLVGVTRSDRLFKIDTVGSAAPAMAATVTGISSLAMSPKGDIVYLAGDGILTIGLDNLAEIKSAWRERYFIDVDVNPNGHTLAMRSTDNLGEVSYYDAATLAFIKSSIVDAAASPTALAASLLHFSRDGSALYYIQRRSNGRSAGLVELNADSMAVRGSLNGDFFAPPLDDGQGTAWALRGATGSGHDELLAVDNQSLSIKRNLPILDRVNAVDATGCQH